MNAPTKHILKEDGRLENIPAFPMLMITGLLEGQSASEQIPAGSLSDRMNPRAWTRWFYENPVEAGNKAREISTDFYLNCLRRMAKVHARFEGFARIERKKRAA